VDTITNALYGPMWHSWATTLLGTGAFAGLLFILMRHTRAFRAPIRWATRGAVFGLVVLPLALWLYAQFFTDPLRALVLGFPGLFLLLHFAPFQSAGSVSHSIVENTAVGASSSLRSAFIPGAALWALVYGFVGFVLGTLIERKRRRSGVL